MATYRLEVADWAFVCRDNPYSNDRTSPSVPLVSSTGSPGCLFLKFAQLPESLWYKSIVAGGADVYLYASAVRHEPESPAMVYMDFLASDLDFGIITYNDL